MGSQIARNKSVFCRHVSNRAYQMHARWGQRDSTPQGVARNKNF
jgi:hypothetical protein